MNLPPSSRENKEEDFTVGSSFKKEFFLQATLGKRDEAKEMLRKLIKAAPSRGDIEVMKARAMSILGVILEGLAKKGVKVQKIVGKKLKAYTAIVKAENAEDLIKCINVIVDRAIDEMCKKKDERKMRVSKKAIAFIEKNFQRDIGLGDVAKEVNLSPWRLAHILKEEIGITFVEYLNQVRVNSAKAILEKRGYKTLTEVAEKVGYKGESYFSKVFKKICGLSPLEFIKGKVEKTPGEKSRLDGKKKLDSIGISFSTPPPISSPHEEPTRHPPVTSEAPIRYPQVTHEPPVLGTPTRHESCGQVVMKRGRDEAGSEWVGVGRNASGRTKVVVELKKEVFSEIYVPAKPGGLAKSNHPKQLLLDL